MNLIRINNKILNLDNIIEITFDEKEITIDRLGTRLKIFEADKSEGLGLTKENIQTLKETLTQLCRFQIGWSEKEIINDLTKPINSNFHQNILNKVVKDVLGASFEEQDTPLLKEEKIIKKKRRKKIK